jgi:hypothetical protein
MSTIDILPAIDELFAELEAQQPQQLSLFDHNGHVTEDAAIPAQYQSGGSLKRSPAEHVQTQGMVAELRPMKKTPEQGKAA